MTKKSNTTVNFERRTISKNKPLTVKEVREFVKVVKVGDRIEASLPVRVWTSTTHFDLINKRMKVEILEKYSNLVKTDKGIFTWIEMILGYYGGGTDLREVTPEDDDATLAMAA